MLETDKIKQKLQSALSNKRYIHTLGVSETAVSLAKVHDINVNDAEIAGLLHDCAKDMPDCLKLSLCKDFHIKLNKAMKDQPDLTHSYLGAEIAQREYGVTNPKILDAIRYHTTGRPKMCKLEKIIFLADFIEPNRKPFKSMDKIKELAYKNLNEAMVFSLAESVKYVRKKQQTLDELTVTALKYYENKQEG